MKAHRIIAIAAAAALAVPTYSSAAESEAPHRIVGYLPDWNYQPFSELDIDELTHINIAFCNPDENGRLFCYIPDDKLKSIVSEAHSHDVEVFTALGGGGTVTATSNTLTLPMSVPSSTQIQWLKKWTLPMTAAAL